MIISSWIIFIMQVAGASSLEKFGTGIIINYLLHFYLMARLKSKVLACIRITINPFSVLMKRKHGYNIIINNDEIRVPSHEIIKGIVKINIRTFVRYTSRIYM